MNSRKIVLGILAISLLAAPAAALAQSGFATNVESFEGTSSEPLLDAITNIVNTLLSLAALVAAVFIVIGGVRYVTSQGDDDAVAAAKNTILYAAIGIIVILLSAVLVNFVIGSIG